ncbi:MAG: helix-turn-helix domain-containing protein, partial [Desulfonatronovibrio sp.]
FHDYLHNAEKEALLKALEDNQGHREKTAASLGISKRSLQYKLKKHGLIRSY